jgi:hypothetical protein
MDVLTKEELQFLFEKRQGLCVSIFLPTHRAGKEILQDPIRLKNLLREAEAGLTANNVRRATARDLLAPAKHLVERKHFWRYQDHGLALFLSEGYFRYFRLPIRFQELVVVADRFHLKPLLSMFAGEDRFYLLALSQKQVRLLEGTRYTANELNLEGVPRSLRDALKYERTKAKLQVHTTGAGPSGQRSAVFHGHGAGIDDRKDDILRYFRQVDKGIQDLLKDQRAPLVLAGVAELFPIYTQANTYAGLLEKGVEGNPEAMSAADLHAAAWGIVQPHFAETQRQAMAHFRNLVSSGRTSEDLKDVLRAAYHGRVEFVFVAVGLQQWGNFHPEQDIVCLHEEPEAGDEDLLNLVAMQTILRGGYVYAVPPSDMPGISPIAAVFRY